MEIESFWEYSDPAGSEARFRAALENSQGDERLEILTQVARTYSLRKRFDDMGLVAKASSPEEFGAFLFSEMGRWKAVLGSKKP